MPVSQFLFDHCGHPVNSSPNSRQCKQASPPLYTLQQRSVSGSSPGSHLVPRPRLISHQQDDVRDAKPEISLPAFVTLHFLSLSSDNNITSWHFTASMPSITDLTVSGCTFIKLPVSNKGNQNQTLSLCKFYPVLPFKTGCRHFPTSSSCFYPQ